MALIKCKECGHEVSDRASVCPKCGCPIQNVNSQNVNKASIKFQPPTKGKVKTYALVFIILCVLIGGGYYTYTNLLKSKDVVELTPEFIKAIRQYDKISSFSEGLAAVKKDEKYGFINTKGKEVIPCKYSHAEPFLEGLAAVLVIEKGYGFVNTKGEEIVSCKYNMVHSFSEGFAEVEKDEKYGFINTKGEEIIPCKYDGAESFSEGFAMVNKDGEYGFINIKGEEVIPCKYDYAESFSEGLAMVNIDGKRGFINTKGEEVIPHRYDYAASFSEGFAMVGINAKYGFINSKGEEVVPCKYDAVESFSEGLAIVNKGGLDGKYGFINIKGEEIISCKYEKGICSFSNGLARVQKDDKYGFVNMKGEEIVPCKYNNAEPFSEGFAVVNKDGKYGFINAKGEEVIPCKYDYAESFSKNGIALVILNKYGFIDKFGKTTFSQSDFEEKLEYEKKKEEEARKAEEERIREEEELRLQGQEIVITMSADIDGTQFYNKQCNVGENSTYWDDIISKRMKVHEGKVLIFKYHELNTYDEVVFLDWMGVDVWDKNGNYKHYETRSCGEFAIFEGETFRTRISLKVGHKGHLDAAFHFREKDKDLY